MGKIFFYNWLIVHNLLLFSTISLLFIFPILVPTPATVSFVLAGEGTSHHRVGVEACAHTYCRLISTVVGVAKGSSLARPVIS